MSMQRHRYATAQSQAAYLRQWGPVGAGFVNNPEDWKFSSSIDYNGGKGLLEIIQLEPLIV